MTLQEQAEARYAALVVHPCRHINRLFPCSGDQCGVCITEALRSALEDGREAGIEDAARLCEGFASGSRRVAEDVPEHRSDLHLAHASAYDAAAGAIRALAKPKETP